MENLIKCVNIVHINIKKRRYIMSHHF